MTSVQSLNTDENTWTTVTTSKKRKLSSHSSQMHDCHQSTPPTDEGPERKRRRTNSVEMVSALSFCDLKGSSDQCQAQHMEDEAAVPIDVRHAEGKSDNLAIRICNCFDLTLSFS